jgi:hypothetical protein
MLGPVPLASRLLDYGDLLEIPLHCGLLHTGARLGGSGCVDFLQPIRRDGYRCLPGAGIRENSCPVRAIELVEVLSVESEPCIGSGFWLAHCPEETRALVRRKLTHRPTRDCAARLEKVALREGRAELYKTQFG